MQTLQTRETDPSVQTLYRALLTLKSEEEAAAFLDDLCTITEVQDMAKRLETASLLAQGRNYQQVASEVSISTATISRVSRCMRYGSGGYRTVLGRLAAGEETK